MVQCRDSCTYFYLGTR